MNSFYCRQLLCLCTVKAVDAAGIRDNTLIFFTSDNGSFMHRFDELPDRHKGLDPQPAVELVRNRLLVDRYDRGCRIGAGEDQDRDEADP